MKPSLILFVLGVSLKKTMIQPFKLPSRRANYHNFKPTQYNCQNQEAKVVNEEDDKIKLAIELLDCLTSPVDENDPEYDLAKDLQRNELLRQNSYSQLKVELKSRGLRSSGDILEMMIRILLHTIDPSISFDGLAPPKTALKYVTDEDILNNKVRRVPLDQRPAPSTIDDPDIDAEDIQTLKQTNVYAPPSKIRIRQKRIVSDGLSRREILIDSHSILSTHSLTSEASDQSSSDTSINSKLSLPLLSVYLVSGRDVFKSWQRSSSVIVYLPSESGWRSKPNRVIADEIAQHTQAIVLIPDVDTGASIADDCTENIESCKTILDAIVSSLHFSRTKFRPRVMTLAGSGTGAFWAAKASCDLWDAASLSFLRLSEEEESNLSLKSEQSSNSNDNIKQSVIRLGYAQKMKPKLTPTVTSSPKSINLQANETSRTGIYSELSNSDSNIPKLTVLEDEYLSKNWQTAESTEGMEDSLDDLVDVQPGGVMDQLIAELQQGLAQIVAEKGEKSDSTIDSDGDDDLFDEETDISESVENSECDVSSVSSTTSRQFYTNTSGTKTTTANDFNTHVSTTLREAAERAALYGWFQTKPNMQSITQSQLQTRSTSELTSTGFSNSSLGPLDLVYLAPRALACFDPITPQSTSSEQTVHDYLLVRLNESLRIPSYFAAAARSKVSFSTAELHSMLLTNQNRIEDFIVQEFEGCSPGFMERLRVVREAQSWTEDDRIIDRSYQVNEGKARNVKHRDSVEALILGCMWLDVYSRDMETDYVAGAGKTKKGPSQGKVVVTAADLSRLASVQPSYPEMLHDEPEFALDPSPLEDLSQAYNEKRFTENSNDHANNYSNDVHASPPAKSNNDLTSMLGIDIPFQ